jgi:hypothetical protein
MPKLTEEPRQRRALARARREAVQAEEDDLRHALRREQWRREGMYLSYEEYVAGVGCRGCGEPLSDGLDGWRPTAKLTDEERAEREAYDARFRERHAECRAARWSIEGSRISHCFYCCPPPPMSEQKIRELNRLFASFGPRDPKELDAWELLLTCDHLAQRTQHRSHDHWSGRVVDCPTCEVRRGVVQFTRVGPANDPDGEVERERLVAELSAESAKLERRQKAASSTEQRIAEINAKLARMESKR